MAKLPWSSLAERVAMAAAGDTRAIGGTGGIKGCLTDEAFKSGGVLRAACEANQRGGPPVARPPSGATPLIG